MNGSESRDLVLCHGETSDTGVRRVGVVQRNIEPAAEVDAAASVGVMLRDSVFVLLSPVAPAPVSGIWVKEPRPASLCMVVVQSGRHSLVCAGDEVERIIGFGEFPVG